MSQLIRHWQNREFRFIGMAAATLTLIGLFLLTHQPQLEAKGSSWRRIDLEAFQRHIQNGDLSDREAQWYHPAQPEDGVSVTAGSSP